jgi:glycosyltransferase involved in cell wall biosynthesis
VTLASAIASDINERPHLVNSRPKLRSAKPIAFVSWGSPFERFSWSGTPFFVLKELQRRLGRVEVIETPKLDRWILRATHRLGFGNLIEREPAVSGYFGRLLEDRLRLLDPAAVVAVAAEPKVAGLVGRWPVMMVSDSFFCNMLEYYDQYKHLNGRVRRIGDGQQRRIIASPATILLSSDWAAQTAADYYRAPRSRFRVAPFGANFETNPVRGLPKGTNGPLKLLFVGYDWSRKGGSIVLSAFKTLRQRLGGAVELHIVGCQPPGLDRLPGVFRHGVLRKSHPGEARRLEALFREASFFFMPSQQEAYGLVFAEACAMGLPPVGADTGGVSTIIRHGVNGLLLPPTATADDYAEAIARVWANGDAYVAMQLEARKAFETRLNWRTWGEKAEAALVDTIATFARAG